MNPIKEILPGIIIVSAIATVSSAFSLIHSSFDALVISIILGMLIANFIKNKDLFDRGTGLALKVFLPAGIAMTKDTAWPEPVVNFKRWIKDMTNGLPPRRDHCSTDEPNKGSCPFPVFLYFASFKP